MVIIVGITDNLKDLYQYHMRRMDLYEKVSQEAFI